MPVRKTTGNSRPLAVCRVISVTTPGSGRASPSSSPPSSSGIWSESATSETRSRKSARSPSGSLCSNSEATACSSARFSTRERVLRVVAGRAARRGSRSGRAPRRAPRRARRSAASARRSVIIAANADSPVIARVPRPGDLVEPVERRAERDALALGERRDHRLGPVPQPALGHVEDAAQVDVVVGVGDRAQVRDRVLDLLALVEPRAADHLVRQADADEHLLQRPGLRVRAVEDGDVAGPDAVGVAQPVDLLGDEPGLLVLGVRDVRDDLRARARVGPQALVLPAGVAADHGVGGRQDGLRRPVVLLQQDGPRVRVVGLELEDVADGRAAERVDRLVGVADDRQLAARQLHVRRVVDDPSRGARRARAPARTARGWCPGTRRPARAGTAAGSAPRRPGTPAAGGPWS